jgi:chromate reductase
VTHDLSVYGLVGSLRRESINKRLMAAAVNLAPPGMRVDVSTLLPEIPLFNEDLVGRECDAVLQMREEVAAADALLIATPEYNGSIPGVLKNCLDWLSLPLGQSVMFEKPVALIGGSIGRLGTARGQLDLRHTFIFSRSPVVAGPEVLLSYAHEHFDADGQLTDARTIELIGTLLQNLARYTEINRPIPAPTV